MASSDRKIYIYDSFSSTEDTLLGTLYVDRVRGTEIYSFEYEKEWLQKIGRGFLLDPGLMSYEGRQFPQDGELFGAFKDAAPDRWGRTLMNRRERMRAGAEGRRPVKLLESDYLLGVDDASRMGGLRFKTDKEGDFLSAEREEAIPPWARLRSLEEASRQFESGETEEANKWLTQLIQPGSSLGGARPKATVADEKGELWIAKFPAKNDENDTGAWEFAVYELAALCDLNVCEAKLEKFSNYGSTYLARRFDRKNGKRIHYASCMTLLGKSDGASAADGTSYLDIAGFIKAYGAKPKVDLEELWKRIVFSMAVTNTDDHLRNHAFIFGKEGWELSPLYDVNPVPFGSELTLNIDSYDNRISLENALEVAPRFGLEKKRAEKTAKEIACIVANNWEKIAKKSGLPREQIENMRPAFRGEDLTSL